MNTNREREESRSSKAGFFPTHSGGDNNKNYEEGNGDEYLSYVPKQYAYYHEYNGDEREKNSDGKIKENNSGISKCPSCRESCSIL